jgi:acyl carrier protein
VEAAVDEIETRVLSCFVNVFPSVDRAELARASQASLASWDSVLQVTLLVALAEEFEFDIDFEVAEELRSFALVVAYVRGRQSHG